MATGFEASHGFKEVASNQLDEIETLEEVGSQMARITAKVGSVVCPDGGQCPDDNTCCLMSGGVYGCCPLNGAVCCADKEHCCPGGSVCGPYGCRPHDPKYSDDDMMMID